MIKENETDETQDQFQKGIKVHGSKMRAVASVARCSSVGQYEFGWIFFFLNREEL